MAEVGTGEGKSIVLAIASAYLAIVGFNIRCACYSQYLSDRDQEKFQFLFEYLNISDKIVYSTFNSICEEILNVGKQDFKEQVAKMILHKPEGFFNKLFSFFGGVDFKKDSSDSPTILLIDEADVFF